MKWQDFYELAVNKVAFSDGSMGVFLQKYGLKGGDCPDLWNLTNPEIIESVHKSYIEAGSNLIITNTFGANRIKLKEFGLEDKLKEINSQAVRIAKKAAGDRAIVAGDVGPTGKLIYPLGELEFDEAVEIYKEQIEVLADSGVDCIFFETHIDILEIKAGIFAAREVSNLPIIASVTFERDGRMLTGTPPESAFITLEALGADIIGTNCGTGPSDMLNVVKRATGFTNLPVVAQANAGLPQLKDGATVYDISAEEYSDIATKMLEAGVDVIGGCCGTTPEHIFLMRKKYSNLPARKIEKNSQDLYLSSRFGIASIGFDRPFAVIGERLNPTARKKLSEDILSGRFEIFKEEAIKQKKAMADILDLNMGIPDADEIILLKQGINILSSIVDTPISIDTSNPLAAREALKIYPGKPILNSISLEEERLSILPEIKKNGCAVVCLPLGSKGVPHLAEERIKNMKKLIDILQQNGISTKNVLADPLALTASANQNSAKETLKTIRVFKEELGLFTTIGLSNISFGLPARANINRSFLAMAIGNGLVSAIANPFDRELMGIIKASDFLMNKDKLGTNYIRIYSSEENEKKTSIIINPVNTEEIENLPIEEKLYQSVLKGNRENIATVINEALKILKPFEILDRFLIPAITEVGRLYEERIYFLPQLILSAETMKNAFSILEPLLKREGKKSTGKIVFATVKGDVHDIGKNIVILMLRNHGFEVYDLGKDVPNEVILKKAIEINADIIGLSALMTTTMPVMGEFMKLQKREGKNFKVMVGGAAVTKSYADSINAYYSVDAVSAVKLALELVS
ncbi:MAG: homocysteine S-methyltransferase family protein [Brevinematia bacterium]